MSIVYRLVALTFFLLVYIIGLVGNGLLIFIVFRQKSLRTVPNLLVVSLTLGDFLFVLFCVPFGAVAYSVENYPFSTFYCRFENFIINLSLGVSVFSLLALSADRYKIIVKPFSTHTKDPSIRLKLVVIAIWVVAACLALPEAINSGLIFDTISQGNNRTLDLIYCWSPNKLSSLNNAQFMIIRQISRLIIYYLMPLTFISVFYILIAKKLFQSRDSIYSPVRINDETRPIKPRMPVPVRASFHQNETTTKLHQDSRARKQLRARKKVAKTVLFLCLVFFLCWLPKQIHDLYWFIGVLVYSSSWNYFWQINKTIALALSYMYSCMNPCALYFLSSTFRHYYKHYLCFCTRLPCGWKLFNVNQSLQHKSSRDRTLSSTNNSTATIFFDLNRVRTFKHHPERR